MLNRDAVRKTTYGATNQILANVGLQSSVGVVVDDGDYIEVNGRKIVKAGTPMAGDITDRLTAFTKATSNGTKGFFTLQITTAFVADETLTIAGVTYTCASEEDVEGKKFAGANAAAQITSLLKMVKTDKYSVAAVDGATDKLGFTQKVIDVEDTTGPTASAASTTGAVGSVIKVTDPVAGTSNAVGVLLHDVDVTDGDANGTILLFGFVDLAKLDTDVLAMIDNDVKAALKGCVWFIV